MSELVRALNQKGYLPDTSDGSTYSDSVAAAVEIYQQSNGLEADGVAGSSTAAHIASGSGVAGPYAVAASSEAPAPADSDSSPCGTLSVVGILGLVALYIKRKIDDGDRTA